MTEWPYCSAVRRPGRMYKLEYSMHNKYCFCHHPLDDRPRPKDEVQGTTSGF